MLFYWQHVYLTHNLPKHFIYSRDLGVTTVTTLVTHIGNLSLNRLKEGQITQILKLFNV